MPGYYTERLAAERLRACYDLAPPRTKAYLEAEIEFVLAKTTSSMLALELGCGYGRVLERPSSQSARGVRNRYVAGQPLHGTGISETQTITMPCLHGLHSNGLSRQRL